MKLRRNENRGLEKSGSRQEWSPFGQLTRLREEINRLFELPFGGATSAMELFEGWNPAFDLYEDNDKFTAKVELPGMKKEDIDISLSGNTLNISGERRQEQEHKEAEAYRSERYFGRFQRSITLPQAIDVGKINASYKDGVLTITVPKTEEAKRKQVDIKVE